MERDDFKERNEQIKRMHDRGFTYKKIADAFGISVERARQIAIKRDRKLAVDVIPRATYIMRGMHTNKPSDEITEQDIYTALLNGIWVCNVGEKTVQQLSEYFKKKVVIKDSAIEHFKDIYGREYGSVKRTFIGFEDDEGSENK
jgi:hypothetical protein